MFEIEKYKYELKALMECKMSLPEALAILAIALEYGKPKHGKWDNNA